MCIPACCIPLGKKSNALCKKSREGTFALRKCPFWNAKVPLLKLKSGTFAMWCEGKADVACYFISSMERLRNASSDAPFSMPF